MQQHGPAARLARWRLPEWEPAAWRWRARAWEWAAEPTAAESGAARAWEWKAGRLDSSHHSFNFKTVIRGRLARARPGGNEIGDAAQPARNGGIDGTRPGRFRRWFVVAAFQDFYMEGDPG